MRTAQSVLVKLACLAVGFVVLPAMAQAPVNDISTSQRQLDNDRSYDSGARTYGAGYEENRPASSDSDAGSYGAASGGGSDSGNMFRQFQQLQEEVASLRGQLEEQAYEIQKLKQQHQDDFASLDRRLGAAAGAPAAASQPIPSATASVNATAGSLPPPTASMRNTDGKEEYEAAYAKLKSRDYDAATTAFKAFVNKYPDSDYAGNSWFWLGFVYQTKGDADAAAKSFATMLERFPDHNKAEDAKYNLGKLYHQQGKTEDARRLLKEVAAGSSKSAPLAKSYLDSM